MSTDSSRPSLAPYIQHTLIDAGVDAASIDRHCDECRRYGFDAAMVPACWVPRVKQRLTGTRIKVASAVDFPFGAMTTRGKVAEIQALVDLGVDEIDVGVQISALRSGDKSAYADDLSAIVAAAGAVPLKVMLELPLLDSDQREQAVEIAVSAGVAYLKNASSGKVGRATPEEIRFLRDRAPAGVGVKGSGGINTAEHARRLLDAGADLVGTSNGVALVTRSPTSPKATASDY
ncbi:deoxyribose-phosphate aldolase [Actinopolymorpha sp. B17G11]|uniref:deoxyribose-phosphate aldolase n=1 Tax=Actinopolymorpha sp. B17G11 TaxID=3160861 RepID=UPI0032E3B159